jgi:hypothetical protein
MRRLGQGGPIADAGASVARHRRGRKARNFWRCYIRQPVPAASARSVPGNPLESSAAKRAAIDIVAAPAGIQTDPAEGPTVEQFFYDGTAGQSADRRWRVSRVGRFPFKGLFNFSSVECKDLASEATCTRRVCEEQTSLQRPRAISSRHGALCWVSSTDRRGAWRAEAAHQCCGDAASACWPFAATPRLTILPAK